MSREKDLPMLNLGRAPSIYSISNRDVKLILGIKRNEADYGQVGDGQASEPSSDPASAVSDAITLAEKIMSRIDGKWPETNHREHPVGVKR
jgi:hypothetical protein